MQPARHCYLRHSYCNGNGQRNVTGINVSTPGAGYTGVPAVSFTPVSGGSGASATAALGRRVVGFTVTGGSGYTSAPGVTVAAPPAANCVPAAICAGATAAATLTPTSVASLTVTNGGNGYTAAPAVTIDPPQTAGGRRATGIAAANTPLLPKAIQELFTLDYGRMNATLGVEIPRTNFLIQTTIPYGYVDPPTEIFKDGEVQFCKITHNGVDTHWIHFHLFNVQVINRVGWDGAVKPPDPNELSWKDTVRMNPLEDIVVALRPLSQQKINATDLDLSNLPNSIRPLDVTEAPGSAVGFTNVDPTNQPATVTNDLTNFGYEYVWHCHILGHEENDMMRAMALVVPPTGAPAIVSAAPTGSGNSQRALLTWTDNSANETAWRVEGSTNGGATWTTVATVQSTTGPQTGVAVTLSYAQPRKTTYVYRVTALNVVGYTKVYAAPAVGYPNVTAVSAPSGASSPVALN